MYPSDTRLSHSKCTQKDIEYAVKYGYYILKSIGVWPSTVKTERYFSNFRIVIGNLVLAFAIVPCILHIIYEEKDTTNKLKLCGLLSFCICSLLKYCALCVRRSGIKQCFEYLKYDWCQVNYPTHRKLMLKYAQIGRKLTLVCAVFMYTGGVIYHTILPFTSPRMIDQLNRTLKPLVYPSYSVLYDVQAIPTYQFVYIVHCMCGYMIYSITIGACGLAAIFAMHACGQIEIVVSLIDNLVEGKKYNAKNKYLHQRLATIVKHHLRVLRFSATLEEVLQEVCLIEFSGSTFMICLLEYYCITEWEESNAIGLSTYAMLLTSLSFNIFMWCYIGESLTKKTGEVGTRCCSIDWYCLPPKIARGMVLIIAMSNNPVRITAGRMIDLSLLTFGNILKTSLAYLSFLRALVM